MNVNALLASLPRGGDLSPLLAPTTSSTVSATKTVISRAIDLPRVELVPRNPKLFARLLTPFLRPYEIFSVDVTQGGFLIDVGGYASWKRIFLAPDFFSTFNVPSTAAMDESDNKFRATYSTGPWRDVVSKVKRTSRMSITFSPRPEEQDVVDTRVSVANGDVVDTVTILSLSGRIADEVVSVDTTRYRREFAVQVDRRILYEAIAFLSKASEWNAGVIRVDSEQITFSDGAVREIAVGITRTPNVDPWQVNTDPPPPALAIFTAPMKWPPPIYFDISELLMLTSLYATLSDRTAGKTILSKQGPLHITQEFDNGNVLVDLYLAPREPDDADDE